MLQILAWRLPGCVLTTLLESNLQTPLLTQTADSSTPQDALAMQQTNNLPACQMQAKCYSKGLQ